MKFYILKDKKLADKKAFELVKKQVLLKPNLLIGLAVGKTTDGLYKLISKHAKQKPTIWENVRLFQIDENLSVSPKSILSFNHEIRKELKDLFKVVKKKNIFLIDGTKNPKSTIAKAYAFIRKNNGIDLIILGIGPEYDPHIAYNTSGKSSLNSTMRVVELHPETIKKIACKGLINQTPTHGITLGIKNILKAKRIVLIAHGKEKAKSIQLAFSGKVSMKRASASALKLHKDLIVVIDKEAAK